MSEPEKPESKEVLLKEKMKPGSSEPPPPPSIVENQLLMEVAQVVPSESKKRKRETVSPAAGEQVNSDSVVKLRDIRKDRKLYIAERLAKEAVDYYNKKHTKDEDKMEFVKMKEALVKTMLPQIYFIYFEDKFLSKQGRETMRSNCRAVVFNEFILSPLEVYSVKLGSLDGKDLKELSKKHWNLHVLFSESGEKKMKPASPEPPPPPIVEETDLENKLPMEVAQVVPSESNKRKRETGSDDDDDKLDVVKHGGGRSSLSYKSVKPLYVRLDHGWCKTEINSKVEKFAKIAVAYYNNKVENDKDEMELMEIKEALSQHLIGPIHINFEAMLVAKDRTWARKIICQAVVSKYFGSNVEVHSLKVGSPEGNDTKKWCKERQCLCESFGKPGKPRSKTDLLKYHFPQFSNWYSSSDDEVEDKNMKPNSPEHPLPASI